MTGLVNKADMTSLPLRSSAVTATIKGASARTTAVLTYYNDHREEIDAIFVLPLQCMWQVVEFELAVEGQYLFSELIPCSRPIQVKDMSNLRCDKETAFCVGCGVISPWVIVEVQVTVIGVLRSQFLSDILVYTFPRTFSPAVSHTREEHCGPYPSFDLSKAVSSLEYTLEIEIFIECPSLFHSIKSDSHIIRVDNLYKASTPSRLRVTLPDHYKRTYNAFELHLYLTNPKESFIVIEDALESTTTREFADSADPISCIMSHPTIMLSYYLDHSLEEQDEMGTFNQGIVGEFVILIERSSTMDRNRIHAIQEACQLFLKSLPKNSTFNIIGFGTFFESLFKESKPYSNTSLYEALSYVEQMKADMGGSSVLEPLSWVLEQYHAKDSPAPLQVFLILSGSAPNPEEIIDVVKTYSTSIRIFTFNLGGADNHLLECLSAITMGRSCQVSAANRLHRQLIDCLGSCLQVPITDVTISWILPDIFEVIYTPESFPDIYPGNRISLYAILARRERRKPGEGEDDTSCMYARKDFPKHDGVQQWREESRRGSSVVASTLRTATKILKERLPNDNTRHFLAVDSSVDLDNEVFYGDSTLCRDTSLEPHHLPLHDHGQPWSRTRWKYNLGQDDLGQESSSTIRDQLQIYLPGRLRKSSSEYAESFGSMGSETSQTGLSSGFGFPGFTTRLGSCKSIDGRSPSVARHACDPSFQNEGYVFNFTEEPFAGGFQEKATLKSRRASTQHAQLSASSSCHDDREKTNTAKASKSRPFHKITKTVQDQHRSTHYVDASNFKIVSEFLEDIVQEKRLKLRETYQLQEEMTKCTWPSISAEKSADEGLSVRRDSGLGNRSSSEPQTSDLDEEIIPPLNSLGHFSKSSSGYFDTDDSMNRDDSIRAVKSKGSADLELTSPEIPGEINPVKRSSSIKDSSQNTNSGIKEKSAASASKLHRQSNDEISTRGRAPTREEDIKAQRRKGGKAKILWTNFTDKIRSFTAFINDQSKPRTRVGTSSSEGSKASMPPVESSTEPEALTTKSATKCKEDVPAKDSCLPINAIRDLETTLTRLESSKTITAKNVYELQDFDLSNYGETSQNAAICLSGRNGGNYFQRLIPFKLILEKETSYCDVTVHQLAAKSIIRELESQMNIESPTATASKDYLKKIISELSQSTHVPSDFTSVALTDEHGIRSYISPQPEDRSYGKRKRQTPWNMACADRRERRSHSRTLSHDGSSYPNNDANLSRHDDLRRLESDQAGSAKITKVKLLPGAEALLHMKIRHSSTASAYMGIIFLTTVEGYWELTSKLSEQLHIQLSELVQTCPFRVCEQQQRNSSYPLAPLAKGSESNVPNMWTQQVNPEETLGCIWATVVSLLFLHHKWQEYAEEWQLVRKKAYKWLLQQALDDGWTISDIIRWAERRFFSPASK